MLTWVMVFAFAALVIVVIASRGARNRVGVPPPPPPGPPLDEVGDRLELRVRRMQELVAQGPGARAEMDRLVADTRAELAGLSESPRLRRMTELVLADLEERRDSVT
jgi:hypothetical protein